MKYTVHLPFYLTQLSLLMRAVNKVCLQLSVKDSVVSNRMGGKLYISLFLEQNSPLTLGLIKSELWRRIGVRFFLTQTLQILIVKTDFGSLFV